MVGSLTLRIGDKRAIKWHGIAMPQDNFTSVDSSLTVHRNDQLTFFSTLLRLNRPPAS